MKNINRKEDFFYLIKYLQKLVDQDLDSRLALYDLTGQQGRVLFFIMRKTDRDHVEVHQNDIENEFHLSKSTVSGLVKRMEKKDVISIEKQHPYAILKPTDKARDILCHLDHHREEAIKQFLNGVEEKDKEITLKTLNKFIENMEREEKDEKQD